MKDESKLYTEILMLLMSISVVLVVAVASLFLRMNRLQNAVHTSLQSLAMNTTPPELERGLNIGSQAPPFTLLDTEGQTVSLNDLAGQETLLVFFSNQCPACLKMLPHLKAFKKIKPETQMIVIARGSVEQSQRLAEELGVTVPILIWEDATANKYKVSFTPFFYVINDKGFIANAGLATSSQELEKLTKTK
jgi:peroxiredoxin